MKTDTPVFNSAALRRAALLAACALLLSFNAACGGAETPGANTAPPVKTGVKPEPDAEVAVIEVAGAGGAAYGNIVIELYPNLAPRHVERFKTLAREGFYNGTTFHRVNPQAGVVQGGDPLSKDGDPNNDGNGGSDYPDLPAEFSDVPFERGIVGAAREGERPAFAGRPGLTKEQAYNTANSQFYITLRRVPQWDGEYTVFGKVIEGLSNAQIIAGAPTRPGTENPADPIVMKSVTLRPRAEFQRP